MLLPGVTLPVAGEHALFFLSAAGAEGARMPVGLAQGSLRVTRASSGERYLVRDGRELVLADPDGKLTRHAGISARRYTDVVAEIDAAVARRLARGDDPLVERPGALAVGPR